MEEFVRLLLRHEGRIYGAILAATLHGSDADDIMQETVLTMCRKYRETEEAIEDFGAWGASIGRNKCHEFRRQRRRGPCFLSDETLEVLATREERLLADLDARMVALEACVAELSQRDQSLLSQRYEQGWKIVEMAKDLGRSTQGLYKSMARIHNVLRECVRRRLTSGKRATT